jgi:hypothetical protein
VHTVHERIVRIGNPQASGGIAAQIADIEAELADEAGRTIDLSNGPHNRPRRGGRDPGVPRVFTQHQIRGVLRIGHTADFADPLAPIIIREADDVRPELGGMGYADGRCSSCVTHPHLAIGEDQTIMILEHEDGCPELERLLRLAGAER